MLDSTLLLGSEADLLDMTGLMSVSNQLLFLLSKFLSSFATPDTFILLAIQSQLYLPPVYY